MIYLDHAATTPLSETVLEAMMPYLTEQYGNPGSSHSLGKTAAAAVAKARGQVAGLFGCEPKNVVFTSGGTEGNNFALLARTEELLKAGKNHVLISAVEHDSVVRAAERLVKLGFYVEEIPVNPDGCVLMESVISMIRPETGMISVMTVNNEVGSINPVLEIGRLCRDLRILFHTDCVQAAGVVKFLDEILCDFATISGHKINGPKGIGAVYVREPEECMGLILGGHNQEFGLRGGTENVAGIVGLGCACEEVTNSFQRNPYGCISGKRWIFLNVLSDYIDPRSFHINGDKLAYTKVLNMRFDDVDGETLLILLDSKGVCVSSGSACRAKEPTPSRTLTAMGLSPEAARSSVRISFGREIDTEEVVAAAEIFADCVNTLRDLAYDSEE